jgi:hypothetical protein
VVCVGVESIQICLDCAHVRPRFVHSHASIEPSNASDSRVPAAKVEYQRIALTERGVNVRRTPEVKVRWQDADDCVADAVHGQGLAEHVLAAAETLAPKSVADDRYRRATLGVFGWQEISAKPELDAESVEESRGYFRAVEMCRRSGAGQGVAPWGDGGHLLEGSCAALPIAKIEVGDGVDWNAGVVFPHRHQTVGVSVR